MTRNVIQTIGKLFKKYPVIWNSSLYVGLYTTGDFIQQKLNNAAQYNWNSTANMAIIAGCAIAPFNYNWYKLLDRTVLGSGLKVAVKKMICDQLIAGSIAIIIFYVGVALLEKQEDKFAELKQKGLKTYKTSCMFWPSVQMINFLFVPSHLRTAYVGVAALIWSNILCFYKHTTIDGHPDVNQEEASVYVR